MPAHNGWVLDAAAQLYWIIQDNCEEAVAKRFRFEISRGLVYVYCESHAPEAILKVVTEEFFRRFNVPMEKWERVFRFPWPEEEWKPYREGEHGHFPGGHFGWRYRDSVLMEAYPPLRLPLLMEPAGSADAPEVAAPEKPAMPAFLRKVMK